MNNSAIKELLVNNPVLEIQYYLRELSKENPEIPQIAYTGVYDNMTREAVSVFQGLKGLPVTGVVDLNTWNSLYQDYNYYYNRTRKPNMVACCPFNCSEVKLGDEKDIVYFIQLLLRNFNRKYKNYKQVSITGRYDIETEEAVKQFQKMSSLPVTGVVDRITWNTLTAIHNTCKLYDCSSDCSY